jgi:hypothetical protein
VDEYLFIMSLTYSLDEHVEGLQRKEFYSRNILGEQDPNFLGRRQLDYYV